MSLIGKGGRATPGEVVPFGCGVLLLSVAFDVMTDLLEDELEGEDKVRVCRDEGGEEDAEAEEAEETSEEESPRRGWVTVGGIGRGLLDRERPEFVLRKVGTSLPGSFSGSS